MQSIAKLIFCCYFHRRFGLQFFSAHPGENLQTIGITNY
jgi:hypothetical protein